MKQHLVGYERLLRPLIRRKELSGRYKETKKRRVCKPDFVCLVFGAVEGARREQGEPRGGGIKSKRMAKKGREGNEGSQNFERLTE